MKKVFLDCGGHVGESIVYFKSLPVYDCSFEIHSFEPLLHLYKRYCDWDDVIHHPVAVWIKDEEVDMFVDKTNSKACGSSMDGTKISGKLDFEHPVKVQAIDFSQWILDTFSKDDYILMKMAIEGAEYPVLEKMLKDGSVDLIDQAYIEFHSHKIKIDIERHEKLISALSIKSNWLQPEWDDN